MRFSVIIPTLNEQDNIVTRIEEIRSINPQAEIIIADGGSTDKTPELALAEGVKLVKSQTGRGAQCNSGADASSGQILVFLHADTSFPPDGFRAMERSFRDKNTQIGTFRLKLDLGHHVLSFYSLCNYLDSVFTRFGDQCIAVTRDLFEELGGFPELKYFEDVEFLQKARRFTGIRLFPATVTTSGRRFKQNGIVRQYLFDAWLMLQYFLGASPVVLARKYDDFKDR